MLRSLQQNSRPDASLTGPMRLFVALQAAH
jgi:hypothetical protein